MTLTVSHEHREKGQQWDGLWHSDVCACFLQHNMTILFQQRSPLRITDKSQKEANGTSRRRQKLTLCHARGSALIWRMNNRKYEAMTMSFLGLHWRLPLPSIFTMTWRVVVIVREQHPQEGFTGLVPCKYLTDGSCYACLLFWAVFYL